MNKNEIELRFGGLAEPLNVQLAAQGCTLGEGVGLVTAKRFQLLADAITTLNVHSYLGDQMTHRLRQKLTKEILKTAVRKG